jgi:hypothetical protein
MNLSLLSDSFSGWIICIRFKRLLFCYLESSRQTAYNIGL